MADISWLNINAAGHLLAIRHAEEGYGVSTFYITENGAPYTDEDPVRTARFMTSSS